MKRGLYYVGCFGGIVTSVMIPIGSYFTPLPVMQQITRDNTPYSPHSARSSSSSPFPRYREGFDVLYWMSKRLPRMVLMYSALLACFSLLMTSYDFTIKKISYPYSAAHSSDTSPSRYYTPTAHSSSCTTQCTPSTRHCASGSRLHTG
jgi:hypothetical protein